MQDSVLDEAPQHDELLLRMQVRLVTDQLFANVLRKVLAEGAAGRPVWPDGAMRHTNCNHFV